MTSRERVLAALDHREPDFVPIDFSGHRSSGVAAIIYPKLRARLGLPPKTIRVYDPIQQLAIVDEDVLDRFGVDTIEMGRGFALDEASWADWVLPDGTPCKMPAWALPERGEKQWVFHSATGKAIGRMPDGALFFEQCHWPFLENENLEHLGDAFAESMWTAMRSPPGTPGLRNEDLAAGARRLRERTDRAIIGLFGGNLLEIGQFLYRNDNFLMLLAGEPARRMSSSIRSSSITWQTWSGFWAQSVRTSTSSSSVTTWACRPAPRCLRRCTASFSCPATR